jgi:hypothetical protein
MNAKAQVLEHVRKPVIIEHFSGPALKCSTYHVPDIDSLTLRGTCVLVNFNGHVFKAPNYLKDFWAICQMGDGFAHIRLNDLEFLTSTNRVITFSDLRKSRSF